MTEAKAAACLLLKRLGFPLTFRNLYVVELAIEAESGLSSIPPDVAAEFIIDCARMALRDGENLNYFWFEDAGWRNPKRSFKQQDELRMRREATVGAQSGPTEPDNRCCYCNGRGYVFNYGPGKRTRPCTECEGAGVK